MLNILNPIDKAKAVKIRTSAPPRPYLPIKALNIYTEYKAMNIISAAQKLLLNWLTKIEYIIPTAPNI